MIPAALPAIVEAGPSEGQFDTKMRVSGATIFERDILMIIVPDTAAGWDAEQIDALYRAAAAL